LTIRNGQGNIVAFASVLTDIPTYQEALAMAFGRDKEEAAKWLSGHTKVIEL
jgi:hypothetical protein